MTDIKTASFVDKSAWDRGPWDDEPDRVEWRVPELPQLACLVVRGPLGSWCGYVGVPPGSTCALGQLRTLLADEDLCIVSARDQRIAFIREAAIGHYEHGAWEADECWRRAKLLWDSKPEDC